jgi:hypothetical protein
LTRKQLSAFVGLMPVIRPDAYLFRIVPVRGFLAYCSYVTVGRQLKSLAPGLAARSTVTDRKCPNSLHNIIHLGNYVLDSLGPELMLPVEQPQTGVAGAADIAAGS